MSTAVQPFSGTYTSDPIHSTLGFAVKYAGVGRFRGTFDDVHASLTTGDDGLVLEGSARVDSISVREPEQFRAHVLSADFFDADNHPEVTFHSTGVELSDDGAARVEGELTIAGKSKQVVATGSWIEPGQGIGTLRAGFELETVVDRRDFGLDWQAELPNGREALGWDVTLDIVLALVPQQD
jgi:polyisoprenoid-binding protein YceI